MISMLLLQRERTALRTDAHGSAVVQHSAERRNIACPIADGGRDDLLPARSVGGLVEHGNDHGRG
jgi:hypothetical protein